MPERIISFIACFMCAVPFLIISRYDKDSQTPIPFWSGDTTLKSKIKDIKSYNQKMSQLYGKCALAFLITGVCFLILPFAGIIILIFDCTVGIYIIYRCYKKILKEQESPNYE